MFVGEVDAVPIRHTGGPAGNIGLTNVVTDLIYGCDDKQSQGNYDYDAHAQVYRGGADHLGSQGYARVVRNPSSS